MTTTSHTLTPSALVAEQEVAAALRSLRSSIRVHLQDNGLMESEAVDETAAALRSVLADAVAHLARHGLDSMGLELD